MIGFIQRLGEHPCFSYRAHEIGVSVPARDNVQMNVIDHSGSGRLADVRADVESLR